MTVDDWARALAARLDIPLDIEIADLLDVARDAAHAVARPAAPVTTFLIGYAAAAGGGGAAATAAATAQARQLSLEWLEATDE